LPKLRRGSFLRILQACAICLVFQAGLVTMASAQDQPAQDPPAQDQPVQDQEEVIAAALEPQDASLADIIERGMLRIAIPYNPIYFSYDGEKMIGFAVERAREFEKFLAASLGKRIDVILVPLPRDQLLDALIEGSVDIVAANLTITPERAERVAFSNPILKDVTELVVTGPAAGKVTSFDDLAQIGVFLRPSSSYYGHMVDLNQLRQAEGRKPVKITDADEHLEDYDLIDMLHAGTIKAIVVDDHKLELWTQVFDSITVHQDLAVNRGGEIAWALRKDTPKLMAEVNRFLEGIKEGSLVGNILLNRYLGSANWIENIRNERDLKTFNKVKPVIEKYAGIYQFDWRMIFAQAYQESKLDQSKKSDAGAVGVMQVLPSTAGDQNVAIDGIDQLDNNIHAGVKYLRFLRERYFDRPEIAALDEVLFSLAAYNAGRGNIARARETAASMNLDPNVWFSNVEVAAARVISREPVIYVRNIYKYYVSLTLMDLKKDEVPILDDQDGAPAQDVEAATEPVTRELQTETVAKDAAPTADPNADPDAAPKVTVLEKATAAVAGREVPSAPESAPSPAFGPKEAAFVTVVAVLLGLFALVIIRRRQSGGGH